MLYKAVKSIEIVNHPVAKVSPVLQESYYHD